jgi:HK97 family phage prohead protease
MATAPAHELRLLTLEDVEWRDAGDSDYTLRGHAAVFNRLSEDLGGFREIIEPGFFRAALRRSPDVRALLNHDSNFVLARTASGTLELSEDTTGLRIAARVAHTSYATDLRLAMQRGDVDQMSFAFSLREGGDDWAVAEDGTVVRTLRADGADQLYDVSVATYPAYEQTDAAMRDLTRTLQLAQPDELLHRARELGRLSPPAPPTLARLQRRARTAAASQRARLTAGP